MTIYESEAAGNIGFFVSLMPSAGALGRFIGPLVGGFVRLLAQVRVFICVRGEGEG